MDETIEIKVTSEMAGKRLDVVLSEQCSDLTRSYINKLCKEERAALNGKTSKGNKKCKEGDVITLQVPEPTELEILPEEMNLDIVYEDQDVILINKPKGMVVHPAAGHYSGTLVNGLMAHCKDDLSGNLSFDVSDTSVGVKFEAHDISGNTIVIRLDQLSRNLDEKADWMMENIRRREWVKDGENGWFNGYYDNNGRPVERCESGDVRMMLTGQVFAIMSGTAKKEQIKAICNSADKYLFDQKAGGYRLNTDFKEEKFDLGRMFGFAYGEKENGAVFSHMAVMYANALYKQGFIKEGYKVLKTLLDTAMDFDRSRMYPGVPEYFDNDGRGLYSYLTGAASWYMLTMITSVYGVHGELGDLVIEPALMPQQYNEKGDAKVSLEFAGHGFDILVHNPDKLEPGDAHVKRALCDDVKVENVTGNSVRIPKHAIEMLSTDKCHTVEIYIE